MRSAEIKSELTPMCEYIIHDLEGIKSDHRTTIFFFFFFFSFNPFFFFTSSPAVDQGSDIR